VIGSHFFGHSTTKSESGQRMATNTSFQFFGLTAFPKQIPKRFHLAARQSIIPGEYVRVFECHCHVGVSSLLWNLLPLSSWRLCSFFHAASRRRGESRRGAGEDESFYPRSSSHVYDVNVPTKEVVVFSRAKNCFFLLR
jgi:hypothetical protein